jgi:phosphatidylglycerophosphate synthase
MGEVIGSAGRRKLFVDAIVAVLVAMVGITVAATSASPLVIGAGAAIAFAAIVQQYAALVFAHVAGRRDAFVAAPLGYIALGGLAAFFATGQPPLLLVGVACWALVDCTWSAIVRGITIGQADRARVCTVLLPLAGRARWRRLGEGLAASRDTAFWGLVVARPIARAVLQLVAEQRWITPNRITVASLACASGAAVAIATDGSVVLALALIGARSVLDSLDGQLARYRACGTDLGSYLDKVSDLFAWGALFAALGIRGYAATARTSMLLLPLVAALVLALGGFALWLARALAPRIAPVTAPARLGLRAWLAALPRIVLFEEPDSYFWIALAVATARYDVFIPLIAGAHVVRALVLAISRAGSRLFVGKESLA